MLIESDAIVAKLVSEFGYTEKRAREAVQKLQASNPAVQEAFEKWWLGKGLDEQLVVQGYTLQKLIEKHGFNPMNAFLTMDWLIREPTKALQGLSRGRDYVLVSPEVKAQYQRRKEMFKSQKEQEESDQSHLNFADPEFERSQQATEPGGASAQTTASHTSANRVEVFISYSHSQRDEAMKQELEKHLSSLKRQGVITSWHDSAIRPGGIWEEIDALLNSANIILLLISPDFIRSDYFYEEMRRAMERQKARTARVIPIILRPIHWEGSLVEKLQALPVGAKPITTWQDREEAYNSVTKGIQNVANELVKNFS